MRVTENSNFDTVRQSIHRSKEKMENLQQQTSTLKRLNQPSDDPVAASKILELRTDKVNNDQYQANAQIVETFLNNTDVALSDLTEIVLRAKEIALNQSSQPSSNDETRLGSAEEIGQLLKNSIATANRRVGERYLFGGFKTQKPPVDSQGNYLGDQGQVMVEIAKDVFLSMNIPGIEAFNTEPKAVYQDHAVYSDTLNYGGAGGGKREFPENVNIFNEIENLRMGLLTGNLDVVRGTLDRFDQIYTKLVSTRAKLGSRLQGLHSTLQSIERHNITNATLSSKLEDADLAQVATDLGREETVFRSSLASSKRLIQPTLLDFLK